MSHTHYVGSDDEYHHFATQHGLSHERLRISIEDVEIEPASFRYGDGRSVPVIRTEAEIVSVMSSVLN